MDPRAQQPEGQSVLDCCGMNDYEAEESDMGSFASDDDVGDLEALEQERDESYQAITPTPAPRCEVRDSCSPCHEMEVEGAFYETNAVFV